MQGLAVTAYEPWELIVVTGSNQDLSTLALSGSVPVEVVHAAGEISSAEATRLGADRSDAELLVLLDERIEPITPGWLGRMVQTLEETGATAVGPRLLRSDAAGNDLSLANRGLDFGVNRDGLPQLRSRGAGEDPLSQLAASTHAVPALSTSCLLVRRQAYEAVGGLDPGMAPGSDEVDLCLKLVEAGGQLVYEGAAICCLRADGDS